RAHRWKGCLAFAGPAWIRWLNKKSTWFLPGQFFWHNLLDNPRCGAQERANVPPVQRVEAGECLVGGLVLPSSVRGSRVSFRDKIRGWESLFTLAGFSFFCGGRISPGVRMARDPGEPGNR